VNRVDTCPQRSSSVAPTNSSPASTEPEAADVRFQRGVERLTNGFSKKVENHEHMLAIYFLHYNFCRVHQTLRVTPAMEAGISNHVLDG
jgi:hypothetical protein